MPEETESRSSILTAVSTPIRLAALVVLMVEGLLAYLLTKAKPDDILIYTSMMVGVLLVTIIAVLFVEFQNNRIQKSNVIPPLGVAETPQKTYKYDVFLAAPMAGLSDEEFESALKKQNEIKVVLEEECGFSRVFFAGTNMKTKSDFDTADLSIETDVNAIKDSQYFVMVYLEKIVTSVLFEAGIAFALGKPSFYFGKVSNFPFLMTQAQQKFDHVKTHEAGTLDDVIKIIRKNRQELFKVGKAKI
ncbi:MAG: hypothetical protein ABIP35_09050 [Ginsengibacter sp.]